MIPHKGLYWQITETARWEPPWKAAYSEHSIAIHVILKAGYAHVELAIVYTELCTQDASSFCDFRKTTSKRFHIIWFIFDSSKGTIV